MVFSSIPAYLDPSNWQQQPNQQTGGTSGNPNLPAPGPGGAGSIRPGSMADRARMANMPMPEAGLKCPRCESSNTKFCYFNNYSLSQPRHFCKTCRRYWTRGGALRNVPVGGGCRRNKRSKGGGSSKSPAAGSSSSSGGAASSTTSTATAASILGLTPTQIPPLRFISPLSQLTEFAPSDLGLNYNGISTGISDLNLSGGGSYIEPWRLQAAGQISSVNGLDFPVGLYPFHGGLDGSGYAGEGSQLRPKQFASNLGLISQMGSVKMEERPQDQLNSSSRQLLGVATGNDQYWSGTAWTDMSGFSSSPTSTNPL
ncbi:hypothetical protein NMG60_11005405 [Bertholletia excelsa]